MTKTFLRKDILLLALLIFAFFFIAPSSEANQRNYSQKLIETVRYAKEQVYFSPRENLSTTRHNNIPRLSRGALRANGRLQSFRGLIPPYALITNNGSSTRPKLLGNDWCAYFAMMALRYSRLNFFPSAPLIKMYSWLTTGEGYIWQRDQNPGREDAHAWNYSLKISAHENPAHPSMGQSYLPVRVDEIWRYGKINYREVFPSEIRPGYLVFLKRQNSLDTTIRTDHMGIVSKVSERGYATHFISGNATDPSTGLQGVVESQIKSNKVLGYLKP